MAHSCEMILGYMIWFDEPKRKEGSRGGLKRAEKLKGWNLPSFVAQVLTRPHLSVTTQRLKQAQPYSAIYGLGAYT